MRGDGSSNLSALVRTGVGHPPRDRFLAIELWPSFASQEIRVGAVESHGEAVHLIVSHPLNLGHVVFFLDLVLVVALVSVIGRLLC